MHNGIQKHKNVIRHNKHNKYFNLKPYWHFVPFFKRILNIIKDYGKYILDIEVKYYLTIILYT